MRSMIAMDTVQIEITNACVMRCGNCTRFCSLVKKPFVMPLDEVKRAIDSMVGYPKMTGIMGGEPLLHPDFEAICDYAREKIPYHQLGLWTTFPRGFEKHREVICRTFKHVFLNDHSRPDIYHQPPLIAAHEVYPNPLEMWNRIDHCWAQMSWSASINPRGAWFCEIAASLAMLFEEGEGWPVEQGWWGRIPKDFREQVDLFCPRCGFPCETDVVSSMEERDRVSPVNYQALKDRVRHPERFQVVPPERTKNQQPQMAAYKDTDYRNRVASRYGIRFIINDQNFWSPYLTDKGCAPSPSIFGILKNRVEGLNA